MTLGTSWHSYPKIYNLGHAALAELFDGPVTIEEKVDGSQFSFGVFDGELRIRSKGVQMVVEKPEAMFGAAVDYVKCITGHLVDGWTYRAEYLRTPKHNTLAYNRIPTNHLMLFDINTDEEVYLPYDAKQKIACLLGIECVPLLSDDDGHVYIAESFRNLLEQESVLGGQKVEGVVVKNYAKFGPDKKALMGKHVSEAFKEVHKGDWRERNPGTIEFVLGLGERYRTPARWQKAVQHLAEAGTLERTPRDIGNLMAEAVRDVETECAAEIKEKLFEFAWPKIRRAVARGLPEWYKDQLLAQQFEGVK